MSDTLNNRSLVVNVLLSWTIPFFASFMFFKPDPATGEFVMALDKNLFKNIMAGLCGPLFSILLHRSIEWRNAGSVVKGCISFFLGNILLDFIILLPMSKMPIYPDYLVEIGALYLIFAIAQGWFGHALAISPRPAQNSFIGLLLRSPLASLTSYVAISFMFDDKQEKMLVPIWHFRTAMVLVTYATVGLNLLKSLQQVRDLQRYALPETIVFLACTMAMDIAIICPVFKWSTEQYLNERGYRLLSTGSLGLIAMSVGRQLERKAEEQVKEKNS